MNKAELMKFAEHGVRVRLSEIQLEINALARAFPHIVQNADGSIPSVVPIEAKPGVVAHNGVTHEAARPAVRMKRADQLKRVALYLSAHPNASSNDITKELSITKSSALNYLGEVGRKSAAHVPGSVEPTKWVLSPRGHKLIAGETRG